MPEIAQRPHLAPRWPGSDPVARNDAVYKWTFTLDAKRRGAPPTGSAAFGTHEVAVIEPTGQGYDQSGLVSDAKRGPHQLPSGRHGLLRSFVAANQRDRILSAVACASAELGYAEMSVEAIIVSAGVSRRTFYEHFKNKEDAFLAAYDGAMRMQARLIRRAYLKETTVRDRLRAGIAAYLQFMASEPELARMCIVEVLAAGPRAMARRRDAMRMFAEIIEDNIHELIPGCRRAELVAETIVGGIHEVVLSRILAGRIDELPALADDLLVTFLMLDIGARDLNARY